MTEPIEKALEDIQQSSGGDLLPSQIMPPKKETEDLSGFKVIKRNRVTRDELVAILKDLIPRSIGQGVDIAPPPTWIEIKESSKHGPSFIAVNPGKNILASAIPSFDGTIHDDLGIMADPSTPLLFFGTSSQIPLTDFVERLKKENPERFDKDISQGLARVEIYIRDKYKQTIGSPRLPDTSWLTLKSARNVLIRETL